MIDPVLNYIDSIKRLTSSAKTVMTEQEIEIRCTYKKGRALAINRDPSLFHYYNALPVESKTENDTLYQILSILMPEKKLYEISDLILDEELSNTKNPLIESVLNRYFFVAHYPCRKTVEEFCHQYRHFMPDCLVIIHINTTYELFYHGVFYGKNVIKKSDIIFDILRLDRREVIPEREDLFTARKQYACAEEGIFPPDELKKPMTKPSIRTIKNWDVNLAPSHYLYANQFLGALGLFLGKSYKEMVKVNHSYYLANGHFLNDPQKSRLSKNSPLCICDYLERNGYKNILMDNTTFKKDGITPIDFLKRNPEKIHGSCLFIDKTWFQIVIDGNGFGLADLIDYPFTRCYYNPNVDEHTKSLLRLY